MFWFHYFALIACILGFFLNLFEGAIESDFVLKCLRVFYTVTFAVAGALISEML